jgi:hypothetical protein
MNEVVCRRCNGRKLYVPYEAEQQHQYDHHGNCSVIRRGGVFVLLKGPTSNVQSMYAVSHGALEDKPGAVNEKGVQSSRNSHCLSSIKISCEVPR